MKWWFVFIILFNACTSARQEKAFQESFLKDESESKDVSVKAPEVLLEKFQVVESTTTVKEEKSQQDPLQAARPTVKLAKAKSQTKTTSAQKKLGAKKMDVVAEKEGIKEKYPEGYPENLKAVNKQAEEVWKLYKPSHNEGEKTYLDIHYLGMTVGKIMVTNRGKKMINGKEVWHLHARFKSAPFYSRIYELDDTVDTYVTTDKFLGLRYSLIQRETKQDVDDLQLADREQMKTFWFYKQKKSDKSVRNKEKDGFIPYYVLDPFSVLFFYQGLPLKNGDVYHIPLMNKSKVLILKSHVEGREVIDTEIGKKMRAIRVHAETKYTGETFKDGNLYFWFSDDEKRTLLKAQAKIKIGSVTADVVDGK